MLFNSIQYAAFLAGVVAVYWIIPRVTPKEATARRVRQVFLLLVSYAFYATWDWRFCILLLAITLINFSVGRALGATEEQGRRRLLLGVSLATGLGALAFFKYTGFLVESTENLLAVFGVHATWAVSIALPIGISFFTFHTLSYTIDIYRRELEPTDDFVVFGVFVAYFPQLLAGPLTRGRRMLPQFAELPEHIDRLKWAEGFELILIGVFQKVAIADALAPFTLSMFSASDQGSSNRNFLMLLVAMAASVIQFVFDFAGYSNIARGSSKLLGIELPYNFRQPITRSRNFQDYWRRHNMTLMAWLRDYVLRPLRRRSDSRLRSSVLLIFVFTLSGLWHGATWGWIVWGLFVGAWVAAEIQVNRIREADRRQRAEHEARQREDDVGAVATSVAVRTTSASRRLLTQIRASVYVVTVLGFSMVLFRSASLSAAMAYYREVSTLTWTTLDWDSFLLFVYAVVMVIIIDRREHRMELAEGRPDPPTLPRAALWGVMVFLIIVFSGGVVQPFVYFRF